MRELNSALDEQLNYYSSEEVVERFTFDATAGLSTEEQEVITRYFPSGEATVLDLGCGTGRTSTELEQMGFDVVGIDLAKPLVQRAQTLFSDVEFLTGNVTRLPFEDETFDAAFFSYYGLDCVVPEENRYRALREIRRILRSMGTLIFNSHNLWSTYVVRSLDVEGVREFLTFWVHNIRKKRLFSRYKSDTMVQNGPIEMYYIRPNDQRQQLRNCGFEVVDVMRPTGVLRSRFHHPYYVARKVPEHRS